MNMRSFVHLSASQDENGVEHSPIGRVTEDYLSNVSGRKISVVTFTIMEM